MLKEKRLKDNNLISWNTLISMTLSSWTRRTGCSAGWPARSPSSSFNGKKVAIVNAELAFVTGNKIALVRKYRTRLNLQEKENPEHSPYWPRRPDMLVRRVVRGMLPYHKKPSGKTAYRNLQGLHGRAVSARSRR